MFENNKGVIDEGQTTQWAKENGQTDKQRSTNIHIKDRFVCTRMILFISYSHRK